ncbi:hypothetical protein BV378_21335 [Nostoc sp. RF31YmG]|nr:hypothetical protein BV378_21335 [Nostoc sp. RF31YmG]
MKYQLANNKFIKNNNIKNFYTFLGLDYIKYLSLFGIITDKKFAILRNSYEIIFDKHQGKMKCIYEPEKAQSFGLKFH